MRGSNPAPGTYGAVTQIGCAVPILIGMDLVFMSSSLMHHPLLLLCRLMDQDTRLRTLGCEFESCQSNKGEQVNIGLLHCPAKTVLINLR